MSSEIVPDKIRAEAAVLVMDEAKRLLADPKLTQSNRVRLIGSLRMLASIGAIPASTHEPKEVDKALPETVASSLATSGDDATGSGRATPA